MEDIRGINISNIYRWLEERESIEDSVRSGFTVNVNCRGPVALDW